MKEIKFKHLLIRNFLSVGDDPVVIDFAPGIHIITGINKDKEDSKNGVGKSTISDALFFAVFGSPLRPIKKENIPNWVNKKDCVVKIEFDVKHNSQTDTYSLTRTLNPSRVQLEKNSQDISRTIGKTNETLLDILGTTSQMFEQSVIMCLNQVEPFLAKTPAIKRKFIEDIFKIEIFGKMSQHMRSDYNISQKSYDEENIKLSELQSNLKNYIDQQTQQKEKHKNRKIELQERAEEIKTETERLIKLFNEVQSQAETDNHKETERQIKELKQQEKELIQLEKEYTKTLTINQTTILNLNKRISEIKKLTEGVCAYCKQPFSESNIEQKNKIIQEHQKEVEECTKIINETNDHIKNIEKNKNKIEDTIDALSQKLKIAINNTHQIENYHNQIKQQNKWLEQTETDLKNLNNEKDSFKEIIEECTSRMQVYEENVTNYKQKLSIIDTSRFIVSDEGVKNFIVKKMLQLLNGRLNYYLEQLDANCVCKFNEYFEETIINNRGKECSYFNFSGGERKRIDLAMLFTFMDIRKMQSNIFVNISIYDELLDTSLDSKGIECTLEILKEKVLKNNEAIYVISHKNEAAKHATGEIIYLEKENDITKRTSYELAS